MPKSHVQPLCLAISGSLAIAALFSACDVQPSADRTEQLNQERIQAAATASVGLPDITNFREKRILKSIYELRDQELSTYTYQVMDHGTPNLVFLGETVGYPIPYATQYTNPQKDTINSQHYVVLPQADPNGLFSPAAAEASWVLMRNPETNKVEPVYFEGKLATYPWKLKN